MYKDSAITAGKNFWHLVLYSAVGLWILTAVSETLVPWFLQEEQPINELRVEKLQFKDGSFHQIVVPTLDAAIRANWAAKVMRDGEFLCGGGNSASYLPRTEPLIMDPHEWTGDECPVFEPGVTYTAEAVWNWIDRTGKHHTISQSFDFVLEDS